VRAKHTARRRNRGLRSREASRSADFEARFRVGTSSRLGGWISESTLNLHWSPKPNLCDLEHAAAVRPISGIRGECVDHVCFETWLTLQCDVNIWVECCFLTKVVLFFNIRIHVHSYACVCIHMHFIVFCMHSDALHSTNRLHSNAFCNHFELLHSSDARRLHSDAFSYLLHSRHVTF